MARSLKVRPYRWLASYYDVMFSPFRGPMEKARRRLLRPIVPSLESACDLGCGTGDTALELARMGLRTCGVDLSAEMCRLTREKAAAANLPVRVIRADMRNFRLPEPVDLIVCEYDALNHVPRKPDLAKVAEAAARALKPDGVFFFDVNNRAGFKQYWCSTFWIERPGIVLVMRNGNDHMRDRAWCDVEWFIRDGTTWRRRRERVEQVCWTAEEINGALFAAGFDRVRMWDAAPFFGKDSVIRRGCRSIYLARKRKG